MNEIFFKNIIAYQISELRKVIINISLELKQLEERYKQTSDEFYHQYMQGQADDSEEMLLWAGLYEMLRDNEIK